MGTLEPGARVTNLAWYCDFANDVLIDILGDIDGNEYRYSRLLGKIQDEVGSKQKATAEKMLPPSFLKLIKKIRQPFFTAISETTASQACMPISRLFLVCDTLTPFRPHKRSEQPPSGFRLSATEDGFRAVSPGGTIYTPRSAVTYLERSYFQFEWLCLFHKRGTFRS